MDKVQKHRKNIKNNMLKAAVPHSVQRLVTGWEN
jgi:hypothetical protein